MVFFVYDQGIRRQESLSRLLKDNHIKQTQASAKSRAVRLKDGPKPRINLAAYRENEKKQKRESAIFVEQVMTSPAITLPLSASLMDAWKLFQSHNFHHIILLNSDHQLAGVISDNDILRATSNLRNASPEDAGTTQLSTVATTQVITCSRTAGIRETADLLITRGIGCIPVANEAHKVEGILTRTDILRALVRRAPLELWA